MTVIAQTVATQNAQAKVEPLVLTLNADATIITLADIRFPGFREKLIQYGKSPSMALFAELRSHLRDLLSDINDPREDNDIKRRTGRPTRAAIKASVRLSGLELSQFMLELLQKKDSGFMAVVGEEGARKAIDVQRDRGTGIVFDMQRFLKDFKLDEPSLEMQKGIHKGRRHSAD
jgi:hypothetical protein